MLVFGEASVDVVVVAGQVVEAVSLRRLGLRICRGGGVRSTPRRSASLRRLVRVAWA